MRRRLFTISVMRFGEIPMAFANWFWDSPYSTRNSSFSISPGVTGANSARPMFCSSVIVADRDVVRVVVNPLEDDPPLVVDPHRIVFLQIPAQLLQPVRRRAPKILQTRRGVQRLELPFRPSRDPLELPHDSILEEPLGSFVAEGLDHCPQYTESRYTVKYGSYLSGGCPPLRPSHRSLPFLLSPSPRLPLPVSPFKPIRAPRACIP